MKSVYYFGVNLPTESSILQLMITVYYTGVNLLTESSITYLIKNTDKLYKGMDNWYMSVTVFIDL